jgi:hypothetical protein
MSRDAEHIAFGLMLIDDAINLENARLLSIHE